MGRFGLANCASALKRVVPPIIGMLLSCAVFAGQIDSSAYFHLRRGMSESEVLVRAGPPDLVTSPGQEAIQVNNGVIDRGDDGEVTFDTFQRTRIPTLTQWHYVPAQGETDPFITIITFRAGEIWEIQRTKVFSRYKKPASSPSATHQESVSDGDIQRERADNTLKAAEAYAATRAKLKDQGGHQGDHQGDREGGDESGAAGIQESTTIYTRTQPDGSTYFGDSPPGKTSNVISVD